MIGERLKEVRKDHKDTQADLARKLNVSLSTVKSWESGNSSPNHDILVAICKLYEVSADFLLGITDVDPLFIKKRQKQLSDESQQMVHLFEEFMLYKQKKESKNKPPVT